MEAQKRERDIYIYYRGKYRHFTLMRKFPFEYKS